MEVDRGPDWNGFVERLIQDWAFQKTWFEGTPKTIFLGGGTPSRLPVKALKHLCDSLVHEQTVEVSMECNPEDLDLPTLEAIRFAGVNRVSIGMQTLNERYARFLNRGCTTKFARELLSKVSRLQWNSWSIDLIFALPGQTEAELRADLETVLELGVPHVSLYGLTWEPGTPFKRALDSGKLTSVPDRAWRRQYDLIRETLSEAGLLQYEVSNFARPGHESLHNQLYWSDCAYMGLGPSAHGYLPDGRRTSHVSDIQQYLHEHTPSLDRPSDEQHALDMIVGGMRSRNGLDLQRLREKTGFTVPNVALTRLTQQEVIHWDGQRIAPTDAGFPISDAIVSHLATNMRPKPSDRSP